MGNRARSSLSGIGGCSPCQQCCLLAFEGGKVLIRIQLYGHPGSGTSLRRAGAQHPSVASHAHALPQSDLRRHGEGQFHHWTLRQLYFGVDEESARAHILSKPRNSFSVEMDCQWKMKLEALATTTLNVDGICTHD